LALKLLRGFAYFRNGKIVVIYRLAGELQRWQYEERNSFTLWE